LIGDHLSLINYLEMVVGLLRRKGRHLGARPLAGPLAALLLAGCGPARTPPAEPPPAVVETAAVEAAADGTLTLSGTLARRREMTLSFRIAGVITAMSVDAGDAVEAGQPLARIDPTGVEARRAQAEAELERVRRDMRRDEALFAQGYVSRQRMDDRRSALKAAEAAYESAAFDRRWASLSAPAGGVVLARLAQRGEVVQPGQAVLRIADLASPLVVRVPVADRDLARIAPGQSVELTLDALPGEVLSGRVVKIGEAVDPRTGAVIVEVEAPSRPNLRSGLTAKARFVAAAIGTPGDSGAIAPGGLLRVPAEAILEANGDKAFVYRLQGDRVRRIAVRFDGFDGDFARIGGLSPGDRVVTAGAGFVSDGERVRVADAAALAGAVR
jgi:RND family efflux transporter MFP subunit